jgi:uncharacterized damage-inducible protein DinB
MPTLREYYLERRAAELPAFVAVLKALPVDRMDYKPHERSPSAEQIAWTLTKELQNCLDVATTFRTQYGAPPPPPIGEIVSLFEQRSNALTDAVTRMSDADWDRVAQFYVNDKLVSEQPVGQFLWFIHFDAIHHRGQLSTYIRPMGGSVPSVYGPTADTRRA